MNKKDKEMAKKLLEAAAETIIENAEEIVSDIPNKTRVSIYINMDLGELSIPEIEVTRSFLPNLNRITPILEGNSQ